MDPKKIYTYEKDKNVLIYKGIQYGKGNLFEDSTLFEEPKQVKKSVCFPHKKFPPILNFIFKNPLMRKEFLTTNDEISKDAYVLNIYAPEEINNCPVLVFIHGGAMSHGSVNVPMYDGRDLASQGILVVVFNYRLSAPGTLWVNGNGNRGYKDQRLALQWVKKNIQSFGGNPENITLAGQSSGALSVLVQLCIEENKDFFHRAVIMSPVFPEMRSIEESEKITKKVLKKAKIKDINRASIKEILKIKDNFMNLVIDQELFYKKPLELLKQGKFLQVPILVGCCSDEFSIYNHPLFRRSLGIENNQRKVEEKFQTLFQEDFDEFRELLKKDSTNIQEEQIKTMAYLFYTAVLQMMEYCSKKVPVYGYHFNFKPPLYNKKHGAYHGSDVTMLFNQLDCND
ncbi:MAG: carboxylesterase family protein, partial [Tissierellia bacterium]|nr:carboxylesterase family protein [Tissierellia bacterium]